MPDISPDKNGGRSAGWRGALANLRRAAGFASPPAAPERTLGPPIVTESGLMSVIAGSEPSLILFDAGWCVPCQSLRDALPDLARDYPSLSVAWVDVDAVPAVSQRYGVTGLPSLVLFRSGQAVSSRMGEIRGAELALWLDRQLSDQEA